MNTSFQIGAFQLNAFQIDVEDASDAIASADQEIGILQVARGKRGNKWSRLGPTPSHDTDYALWLETKAE